MRAETPMNGQLPLRLRNLSYGGSAAPLLGPLSLELREPGITVVLGANGAGKSLLLRLLHGLLPPSEGRISWGGRSPRQARRDQALVFQRPVMLRRSALANVTYALALKGMPSSERKRAAREALAFVGLEKLARRPARVLSGGEQQRVALARAAAVQPEVLLMDEATANLDPAATRSIERSVERLAASGVKVLMTTHDLGQARRLAQEILFLDRGRLLAQAPAEDFFARPGSATAEAFLMGELPPDLPI